MTNAMRIRVLKKFPSPLDNRMLKIDSELNVPKSQFWFRRIDDKDCIKIKSQFKVAKAVSKPSVDVHKSKKGSK